MSLANVIFLFFLKIYFNCFLRTLKFFNLFYLHTLIMDELTLYLLLYNFLLLTVPRILQLNKNTNQHAKLYANITGYRIHTFLGIQNLIVCVRRALILASLWSQSTTLSCDEKTPFHQLEDNIGCYLWQQMVLKPEFPSQQTPSSVS